MPLQEISITLAAGCIIAASAVFAALAIFQRARGDVVTITETARKDYVELLLGRIEFLEGDALRCKDETNRWQKIEVEWEKKELEWQRRELELLRMLARVDKTEARIDKVEEKLNGA